MTKIEEELLVVISDHDCVGPVRILGVVSVVGVRPVIEAVIHPGIGLPDILGLNTRLGGL